MTRRMKIRVKTFSFMMIYYLYFFIKFATVSAPDILQFSEAIRLAKSRD
jgi:hypothetical protein